MSPTPPTCYTRLMQNVLLGIVIASQFVQLMLRIQEVRKMRNVVNDLHQRGLHQAATLTRGALLPNDLPSFEQIELMRRDSWPSQTTR
jgi:Flp pilus assembly secretin CpaC